RARDTDHPLPPADARRDRHRPRPAGYGEAVHGSLRLHSPVQLSRPPGGQPALRVRRQWLADRVADRRPTFRRGAHPTRGRRLPARHRLAPSTPAGARRVTRPKVAFIGTGGTIASVGRDPLDLQDYGATGTVLHADELLARFPETVLVADVLPVRYRNVPSTAIDTPDWQALVLICDQLVAEHPDLAGIVIGHGTASLEETAYFLNLTLKVSVPVVLVGAQRPNSALSSDAGLNLVNAIRTAASPEARGMGALVVLNDEIQAARDVTKTSTLRLQTFRTADFGVLGHADGDAVAFYRRPLRRAAPDTEFDVRALPALPRVDI